MQVRKRLGAILAAASLGAALATGVPTAAAAGHGHSEKRHSRWHRGHHDFGHPHRAPYRVYRHGASCDHAGYARRGYLCRPCGHHFASLDRLHAHVHHHHHVPFWRLPFVIVAHAAGFFVYG